MNTIHQSARRSWSFPTKMVADLAAFTALIWLGFVIVVSVASYSIDRWGTLDESVWAQARQAAQWFFLFLGVYVGSDLLPRYIAHGKTRRDFFIESSLFVATISAIGAGLVTLGWIVERALFSVIEVEQTLRESALFDSARDYGMIYLESLITLSVWTLAGLFVSITWYRNANLVIAAIAAAIVVGAFVELGTGSSLGPMGAIARRFFDPEQPPLVATFGITAVALSALATFAWLAIRDIPIRNVSA